ncbi:hypothetical protein M0657_002285 [Pyricularia oryzae]|nr:hypothetical protein M9X92_003114 [Pyricularia oryzae]KAI7929310.1 hypothetical protein M0657_002285 [Pyricularia oryzae]
MWLLSHLQLPKPGSPKWPHLRVWARGVHDVASNLCQKLGNRRLCCQDADWNPFPEMQAGRTKIISANAGRQLDGDATNKVILVRKTPLTQPQTRRTHLSSKQVDQFWMDRYAGDLPVYTGNSLIALYGAKIYAKNSPGLANISDLSRHEAGQADNHNSREHRLLVYGYLHLYIMSNAD